MTSPSPSDPADLLSLPPDEAAAGLRGLGFRDGVAALRNLEGLLRETPPSQAPRALLSEIAASADPDTALNHFERLAGAAISRSALLAMLEARPEVCRRLTRLLSVSPFLADLLVRNPTFRQLSRSVSPVRTGEGGGQGVGEGHMIRFV